MITAKHANALRESGRFSRAGGEAVLLGLRTTRVQLFIFVVGQDLRQYLHPMRPHRMFVRCVPFVLKTKTQKGESLRLRWRSGLAPAPPRRGALPRG